MQRVKGLLIGISLLLTGQLSASHLLGGEITWECKNNGSYEFTLKLYRDCTGIDLAGTTETISGPGGSFTVTKVATNDLSPVATMPLVVMVARPMALLRF
ncbi:MAG: hypothetical protein U5L96_08610 [Owenweeksia sp.]|nr:hypothetical protein [Owenweeksia sp.]